MVDKNLFYTLDIHMILFQNLKARVEMGHGFMEGIMFAFSPDVDENFLTLQGSSSPFVTSSHGNPNFNPVKLNTKTGVSFS